MTAIAFVGLAGLTISLLMAFVLNHSILDRTRRATAVFAFFAAALAATMSILHPEPGCAQTPAPPLVTPMYFRSGTATTDSSGNASVTLTPALPGPAIVSLSYSAASTATYSCHPVGVPTATGFSINCATVTYGTLGGAPQRTAIAGLVVQWTATN